MCKCEYKNGYVAYLDILGFSDRIKGKEFSKTNKINRLSPNVAEKLFRIFEGLSDVFSKNENLNAKMLFGSDSIFLSSQSDDFSGLLTLLEMVAFAVYKELGLLIRGGIAKGSFYHDKNNIFGPAVVDAVNAEKKAKYSRIILDKNAVNEHIINDEIEDIFTDYDGESCVNFYSYAVFYTLDTPVDIKKYSFEELFGMVYDNLKKMRSEVINICRNNSYQPYFFINAWQIIPFNNLCRRIIEDIHSFYYFYDFKENLSIDKKEKIEALMIKAFFGDI